MQEPVKTVCFGAGRGGPGKSESANSGATKPVPFLKNERTNDAALAELAHEKQWTVAAISGRTFLAHQPAPHVCAPSNATGTLRTRQDHVGTSATPKGNALPPTKSCGRGQGSEGPAKRIPVQLLETAEQIAHRNFAQIF